MGEGESCGAGFGCLRSQLVGGLRSGVAQLCTEQRAERSNVRAVGISAEEPIFAFGRSWGMHWCRVKRYLER
jgi:hypothetical protein